MLSYTEQCQNKPLPHTIPFLIFFMFSTNKSIPYLPKFFVVSIRSLFATVNQFKIYLFHQQPKRFFQYVQISMKNEEKRSFQNISLLFPHDISTVIVKIWTGFNLKNIFA